MQNVVVLGASGEVGRGIVAVLLEHGACVAAVGRNEGRLEELADELGRPARLVAVAGSVATDGDAAALLARLRGALPAIDAAVVCVNAPRRPGPLLAREAAELTRLLEADLVAHFVAARHLLPALSPGGTLLGIGGGSCDFVLHDGVAQSVAQAGLRMLYRGLAHECRDRPLHVRELVVASVVNARRTRAFADPSWVTEREIGEQVAALIERPAEHPGPILRLARRDASGRPVFSSEGPSRVQGFRQKLEA